MNAALALRHVAEQDVVFRPSRRDIDPETGNPEAHALWDRHGWHLGACWFWCAEQGVEVTWLGPIQSSGLHADMYACRRCLYRLDQLVLSVNLRKDSPGTQIPAPAGSSFTPPTGAGRHRKTASTR